MANPQIEKGHTRIANEILEQISKTNLNGTQFRIVMVIWRYTYGFQRKQHELSYAFFSQAIGIKDRKTIYRELKTLIDRKIVSVVGNGSRGVNILSFNKNHDEWLDCPLISQQTELTANMPTELTANMPTELTANMPPKKEIIKEIIKENTRQQKTYDEGSTFYKMAKYFHDKVSIVAKDAGVEHLVAKANLQKWADDFRKLIEIDQIDKRLAKEVMDWVVKDTFWKTNVLSAKKLRERFTDLAIKMKSTQIPKKQNTPKQVDPRDKDIEFQKFLAEGGNPDDFDWGS
jgi:phage replication O-like protein O